MVVIYPHQRKPRRLFVSTHLSGKSRRAREVFSIVLHGCTVRSTTGTTGAPSVQRTTGGVRVSGTEWFQVLYISRDESTTAFEIGNGPVGQDDVPIATAVVTVVTGGMISRQRGEVACTDVLDLG